MVASRTDAPSAETTPTETPPGGPRRGGGWSRFPFRHFLLLPIWLALIVVFGILEPETFLRVQTIRSIAGEQAITALMALALLLPMAAGVWDVSVGGTLGLSIVLIGWLQVTQGLGGLSSVMIVLLAALLIGVVNSVVIVRFKVSAFIVGLGMLSLLGACEQLISGGRNIAGGFSDGFIAVVRTQFLGFSMPFYIMLIVGVVIWYVLSYRRSGRYLYATGANPDAARLAGVRTSRLMVVALLVSAVIAALAGILFAGRVEAAPLGSGFAYVLPAFAAAFLGATQSRSGLVNVAGTIVAVYTLATGVRGLQLLGAPFWIGDVFNGVALIAAVALAGASRRRAGAAT